MKYNAFHAFFISNHYMSRLNNLLALLISFKCNGLYNCTIFIRHKYYLSHHLFDFFFFKQVISTFWKGKMMPCCVEIAQMQGKKMIIIFHYALKKNNYLLRIAQLVNFNTKCTVELQITKVLHLNLYLNATISVI